MSLTPKIAISDDFLSAFAKVPRSSQQGVLTFMAKFRQNPQANGINYEKINDAADPNMRSVRITHELRGIVLKPDSGNVYCMLWVDHHDKAYTWARRHRVAIHPDIGSVQVYSVAETEQAPSTPAVAPPSPAPIVGTSEGTSEATAVAAPTALTAPVAPVAAQIVPFAALNDLQIRKLGVPDDKLALVRATRTERDLDALERQIPDEAYEALFLFAAGEPYDSIIAEREAQEQVDTEDFGAALERTNSRRHFLVLTEDSDLEALLAAPLETWRVFLHPSQRKLVERDWSGPVKVTGGAGTGKTVVAMHRARRLARQYAALPGRPIVFTTYTRTLAEDIRRNLRKLCSPQEMDKIEVINVDQWAAQLVRGFGYQAQPLYDEGKRLEFWSLAMTYLPPDMALAESFLRAEFERVVLPQNCESAEGYMHASRIGRGGPLGRKERKAIWPVFAEYRALLRQNNFREPEEMYHDALILLTENETKLGIRCMIVDESQDTSAAAFALIRAAVPVAENDLFLVGDAHQRIYRHRVVLGRVGIEVRGRSRKLRINYRTTDEIRRWACAQLEGCEVDDLDGNADSLKNYVSLTHGDPPDVKMVDSREDTVQEIVRILEELDEDVPREQVCIAARTNTEVEALATLLRRVGVECLKLDRDTPDNQSKPGVRLSTMHRIKGLEFSVVILASYLGAKKYAEKYAKDEDAGVTEETELNERCLLHVAATRAKRHLFVLEKGG